MASALNGWSRPSQMREVRQAVVDFEVREIVEDIEWFDVFLTPTPSQKVERKPEGLRTWKWWDAYSTKDLQLDTVVQDPEGLQFRVMERDDWSQSGFFHYALGQQPVQGPAQPAAAEAQL